jgi:L-alanine-DL-glutamate epimerase-like enolase superfamily enzyme
LIAAPALAIGPRDPVRVPDGPGLRIELIEDHVERRRAERCW